MKKQHQAENLINVHRAEIRKVGENTLTHRNTTYTYLRSIQKTKQHSTIKDTVRFFPRRVF